MRQTDGDGHGSHVLGSAAGDDATFGGMAPGAQIIVVKTSFFTNDIVSAISFVDQRAASLGLPYAINMSLGSDLGPHDGTGLMSQAIDNLTGPGKPGKAIVVAAGNSGGDKIHAGGNGTQTVTFNIPAGTQQLLLNIWYEGSDSFTFGYRDRNNAGLDGVGPGQSFPPTPNTVACITGTDTCIRVDHSVTQTANNAKEITFLVIPRPSSSATTIDLTGNWSFSLTGTGNFNAWVSCFGALCEFPLGDTSMTVGSPAVAASAVAVGSYVTKACWASKIGQRCYAPQPTVGNISSFSSIGPTRDGRQKPDIAAPGQAIVSSLSTNASFPDSLTAPGDKHAILQGTSMASPHVAGAVVLLLAQNPNLDAAQIEGLLQSHAVKDSFTGGSCNNTWGCGKLSLASIPSTGLTEPSLMSPENGAFLMNPRPLFSWKPSTGAASYQLQVTSADINTGPFAIDVVVNPATQFQATADLADDTYSWHVIARDAIINTASSTTRTFIVDTKAPTVPANLSEETTGDEHERRFTWSRSTDPGFVSSGNPLNSGSGVAFYKMAISGDQQIVTTADEGSICTGNTCEFTAPVLTGDYTIKVTAWDRAGNESGFANLAFRAGCVFPIEIVKAGWNLVGWACSNPGLPQDIASRLGVSSTAGLVRLLAWDAVSQSFTQSYRSDRPSTP